MGVQRGSAKHGRIRDESHKRETLGLVRGAGTSRAQDWRDPEEPAEWEDALEPHRYPPGHEPGTSPGITPADVERRSTLAKWLSDTGFPADKERILAHAERRNAPDGVVDAVRRLPDEVEFHTVGEIAETLGLGTERERS
ncbi:hypothetical protein TBS_36350 [Thermobispora bispora]|jgi:hypothetical protein|uniref:DUF2795 domain-containing protein n=1 Tax=Thermobispora bispora (strain ATCC 19993 / DSM 43833 / CBS 139.67 / JCM 10125 / KCTC 9307 / NBRC 14880 / R51) TaxID=469371 RepID=D6Y4U1_THEBD|nr:DUF2795 domain-containing protein [Thermobispora bispora]MBO2473653.1 DUF2795 domain-containing protein [Actinomycetales bacterium]MDI9581160.1 DUF2795 domain-containing protein [Thermobispora sp.]ADG89267.1 hypothetical protein Tbis_2565 [Thermobispora bispora DSM 43833]MBX6168664.1 DUF2795 domain-containing protein [Thermobispora bispora]QSI48942.1 DUF2795 domain-containing protein [Thermobispora bispora]